MFTKVLIANRGAIACRIIRTLHRMGVKAIAVMSTVDRHAAHAEQANESILLGEAPPADSYLNVEKVLAAAIESGAQAIHPGYGFLSENGEFAEACERAGLAFIGPTPQQMRAFGLKHRARELAEQCGLPLLPGTALLQNAEEARQAALRIGLPVMLKSTAGGGGIGMRLCREEQDLTEAFESVQRTSLASFLDSGIFIEKYVERARHIEVQIFGDGAGRVIALGERDCSVQRRNQKVIEETPAHGLPSQVRDGLLACAVRLGKAVNYRSAGTVEFVYDDAAEQFYFLEVNTRLQVEHGVTEEVTGIDLVEWMVRLAAREFPPLDSIPVRLEGCSMQVRVYAEDPAKNFQPSAGLLTCVDLPAKARTETWVHAGTEVTPFYDPLLAKVIVHAGNRAEALAEMTLALQQMRLGGIETNLEYLRQVVSSAGFEQGGVTTRYLETLEYRDRGVEVIEGGTLTTVQDDPGRLGYWHTGVPPSGPMDGRSFRLGNRLLGNPAGLRGLECTVQGPTLRFRCDTEIALTGADFDARLNGEPVAMHQAVAVSHGAVLELGGCQGLGARGYVLFRGGLDIPEYLGSASTFTLGGFGGHGGRALRSGDVLHLKAIGPRAPQGKWQAPVLTNEWRIGVLYGPHGAPDFFTPADIETIFTASWKVHYNSSRTGVRLIGPKPEWARPDGGEAGLHPSNIHDNAYAIGAVDFTGDMPVILGPDGPSLGGFVCPVVVASNELWKVGQLRAGDTVQFVPLTLEEALRPELQELPSRTVPPEPVIVERMPDQDLVCRASGDRYLLIEYGEPILDLKLRLRVQELLAWFKREKPEGIIDVTPGIRSIQFHYHPGRLSRSRLLEMVERAESSMPNLDDVAIPSRIVHLPLSWDDPATRCAIDKYMQSVRPDAPWCPSNIEFIRRINGLDSSEDVRQIVFDASYLVLGLGDVYLGAPVATPLDPRHRLVTTKYNPARTWTAENSVGIGGAYLCIYGMEGPGGYQFVGRTLQVWNTWRTTREFKAGRPWLLRYFDQIHFYPVEAGELLEMRDAFPNGKLRLQIEKCEFRLREYNEFLATIRGEASAFKTQQQAAFEQERERWRVSGLDQEIAPVETFVESNQQVPAGCLSLKSPTHANVWNIAVKAGDRVQAGQKLVIVESMKMEIAVAASQGGTVVDVLCRQGTQVAAGQHLLFLRPEAS